MLIYRNNNYFPLLLFSLVSKAPGFVVPIPLPSLIHDDFMRKMSFCLSFFSHPATSSLSPFIIMENAVIVMVTPKLTSNVNSLC